jgi:hypothetical protein
VDADAALAKLPNFSYLIESMAMFEYKGAVHLMVAYENKSVQIFDYSSGHSIFEFDFSLPSPDIKQPVE